MSIIAVNDRNRGSHNRKGWGEVIHQREQLPQHLDIAVSGDIPGFDLVTKRGLMQKHTIDHIAIQGQGHKWNRLAVASQATGRYRLVRYIPP